MLTNGLGSTPTEFAPSYCSWMPFSSFLEACKLPSQAQVFANDMSNLGGSVDPAVIQQLQQQWARTDAQQCASHPEDCAAYQFAIGHPDLSAFFGTGSPAQTVANIADFFGGTGNTSIPWILITGFALAAIWILKR